jgi:hypothetical protein
MIEVNQYTPWLITAFSVLAFCLFTLILALWVARGKIIEEQSKMIRGLRERLSERDGRLPGFSAERVRGIKR